MIWSMKKMSWERSDLSTENSILMPLNEHPTDATEPKNLIRIGIFQKVIIVATELFFALFIKSALGGLLQYTLACVLDCLSHLHTAHSIYIDPLRKTVLPLILIKRKTQLQKRPIALINTLVS